MSELAEGHTVKGYDVDLTGLRMRFLEMGGLVLDQVQRAARALSDNDLDLARTVLEQEQRVNNYDLRLDEDGIALIARRQPMGGDLRVIISIARAVTDLERIGDECKKIARYTLDETAERSLRPLTQLARDVRRMAPLALAMLREALNAFDGMNPEAAIDVARQDQELNAEFHAAMRRLVTVVMEDPRRLQAIVDAVFVLKALERIGDHAKNIARYIVYLVQGRDVRHDDTVILTASLGGGRP